MFRSHNAREEVMTETSFWARFALAVLATWRVTHLLASEDGPVDIIVRFRGLLGGGIFGRLMDCFNCLSLWIAAPTALFVSRRPLEWVFCWLALSGGACLLERIGQEQVTIQSMSQQAEADINPAEGEINPGEGEINNVLRSETLGIAKQSDAEDGGERPPTRLQ